MGARVLTKKEKNILLRLGLPISKINRKIKIEKIKNKNINKSRRKFYNG
jgi:hypothetical protein